MADVALTTDTVIVTVHRSHCDDDGMLHHTSAREAYDRQEILDWLHRAGMPTDQVPRDHLTINHWSRTFTTPLVVFKSNGELLLHPREHRVMFSEPYTQEWRTDPPEPFAVEDD